MILDNKRNRESSYFVSESIVKEAPKPDLIDEPALLKIKRKANYETVKKYLVVKWDLDKG